MKLAAFHVLALSALILGGCGSALETGVSTLMPSEFKAQDGTGLVLSEYVGIADPLSDQVFQLLPHSSGETALKHITLGQQHGGYLGMIEDPNLTLSNWSFTKYDEGSNSIHLHFSTNLPCVRNDTGNSLRGLKAHFSKFTDSNVNMSQGASSSGNGYDMPFHDLANNDTVCRRALLTNTSATAYTFHVQFLADSQDSNAVVPLVDGANGDWAVGRNSRVSGTNFGAIEPTVQINGNNMTPLTFWGSTVARHTPASIFASEGFVTVTNNSASQTATGPYITQTTKMVINATLPVGQGTKLGTMFFRLCNPNIATCNDVNSCLTPVHDAQTETNFSINETTPEIGQFLDISESGASIQFQIIFDTDNSGSINQGDHYTRFTRTLNAKAYHTATRTFSSTIGVGHTCP